MAGIYYVLFEYAELLNPDTLLVDIGADIGR